MDEPFTTQRLLDLRRLTRAIAEVLRERLMAHLGALAPLLRPRLVFGDHVKGGFRESGRDPAGAYRMLHDLYVKIGAAAPYGIASQDLKPPLDLAGAALETAPVEYAHVARAGQTEKSIVVTSPFKWTLAYAGFGLEQLGRTVRERNRFEDRLAHQLLHELALHVALVRQPAIGQLLEDLHFTVSTGRGPDLGELPVTQVTSAVPSFRPPDAVLIESTEVSGQDAFQEVVDVEAIGRLEDPLKKRLLCVVESFRAT
jgi:hypothetical protein